MTAAPKSGTGVRGLPPSPSKLPLILAILLLSSMMLLVIFSVHNPDDGMRPPASSGHLLRDRVKANRDKEEEHQKKAEESRLRDEPPTSSFSASTAAATRIQGAPEAVSPPHSSLRAEPKILVPAPVPAPPPVPLLHVESEPADLTASDKSQVDAPWTPVQMTLTVPQHAVGDDSLVFARLRRHYVDLVIEGRRQYRPSQLNDEDVVEVLHRALNTGSLSPTWDSSPPQQKDLVETLIKVIKLKKPKTFFDVTTSSLPTSFGKFVSDTFPWMLSVLLPVVVKKTPFSEAVASRENLNLMNATAASSNLYVAKTRSAASAPFPGGVFDCLQVIEGLDSLVSSQLPFEFEESLGRALCRCNTTILPKDLPRTGYFSFWESTSALLLAAVVAAQDLCSIRLDLPADFSRIRYSHAVVQRYDNSTALSTPSGHLSPAHLAALGLSGTSVHHLAAAVNDHCNAGPPSRCSDMPAVLAGLAMSGSMLSNAGGIGGQLGSTMRRLRLIHTVAGDDEGKRKPVARPTYYVPSNRSAPARTPPSPSFTRRRLLSYVDMARRSAESVQAASVQSTWELLEQSGPSASLGEYDTRLAPTNDTAVLPPAEPVVSLSRDTRLRQRSMQEREEVTYRRWSRFLQEEDALSSLAASQGAPAVYMLGRHIGMLGSKLAQTLATLSEGRGLLVALHTDELSVQPHMELLDLLGVRNTLLCHRRLSGALLAAMLGAPEQAEVSIVQADVPLRLLSLALGGGLTGVGGLGVFRGDGNCGVEAFEEMLAAVLSLAQKTFIELPSRQALEMVVTLVAPHCASEYSKRYFAAATDATDSAPLGAALLRLACARLPAGVVVDISERHFSADSDGDLVTNVGAPAASSVAAASRSLFRINLSSEGGRKVSSLGVSVYSLLHLGIHASQKKHLLLLFMELPLWALGLGEASRVAPWTVFARPSEQAWSLWHHAPTLDGRGLAAAVPGGRFRTDSLGAPVGASQGRGGYAAERARAKVLFSVVSRELARYPAESGDGRFSWVEHGSGYGFFSALLSAKYPNATIVTLESDDAKASHHVAMADQLGLLNIAVCNVKADAATVLKNIVESPELFRFQLFSHSVLDSFAATPLVDWGLQVGTLLSTALTTFLLVPPARQVSLAFDVFFGETPVRSLQRLLDPAPGPGLGDAALERPDSSLTSHPRAAFKGVESMLLLGHARAKAGDTHVSLSHVLLGSNVHSPFIRADIVNMTRKVHHHFDYAKDGHTRQYTMRIAVNQTLSEDITRAVGDPSVASATQLSGGIRLDVPLHKRSFLLPAGAHPNHHSVVDVHLVRDKDQFPIPYIAIHGVTLITALRLGLENSQRDRLFRSFLQLPLFEDMAPWNIVLSGSALECTFCTFHPRKKIPKSPTNLTTIFVPFSALFFLSLQILTTTRVTASST